MESLIFASIAIVILIPAMYFLPLGFSFRGKMLIISAALMIALLGLLATPLMPLWQTGLILVLLIGVFSYFLAGKIPVLAPVMDENEFEFSEESSEPVLDVVPDVYSHIATSDSKEDFYEGEEGLLEKAMRRAGAPQANALLTGKDEEEETDFTELGLTTFTEVAVTEEQQIDEEITSESANHAYLGDMEEMLIVDVEENGNELPISSDSALEESLIETDEVLNSLDELDDLEELSFDDLETNENDSKEDSDVDEEFWNSLLEDDELEVIEEKKELADVK